MRFILLFQIVMLVPSICISSDLDYCSSAARRLSYAASDYNDQIDQYNSACDPYYGYAKDDSGACGPVGYMKLSADSAQTDFESAYITVVNACSSEANTRQHNQKEIQKLLEEYKNTKGANPPKK